MAGEIVRDHVACNGCPNAIFCFNDERASAALRGLNFRVPQDVWLIGPNGIEETAYHSPCLSTIGYPIAEGAPRLAVFAASPGTPRRAAAKRDSGGALDAPRIGGAPRIGAALKRARNENRGANRRRKVAAVPPISLAKMSCINPFVALYDRAACQRVALERLESVEIPFRCRWCRAMRCGRRGFPTRTNLIVMNFSSLRRSSRAASYFAFGTLLGAVALDGALSYAAPLASPVAGAPLRFDFGDVAAPTGYVAVDPALAFSSERGYGWVNQPVLAQRDRIVPDDPRRDFVTGSASATFRIAGLAPGNYQLSVVSGDLNFGDHVTRVRVLGSETAWPQMAPQAGEFMTVAGLVTVGDSGTLDVAFDAPQSIWVVNALSLESAAPSAALGAAPTLVAETPKTSGSDPNRVRAAGATDSLPASLPQLPWHLTARPWKPLDASETADWNRLEAAVRALAPMQYWNEKDPKDVKNGALIDQYAHREIQYATPLFAFNVAALLSQGRASDLAEAGARALDRATLNISTGKANDSHGEFFPLGMVKALRIYDALQSKYPQQLSPQRIATWKTRLQTPREVFMELKVRQNWRTFAMKGEWLRQKDGYISDGVNWIESNWLQKVEGGQRERFREDLDRYDLKPHFFLYHDHGADPETFAYNGATTANLLDMLENGYNGPSAKDIRDTVQRALRSSLLLLGGSGEAAAGGRTGEHIWDDSIYADGFEMMAEICKRQGDLRSAGQFRRAALLLLQSHARFQQERGWFSITKNQFHSSLKNRYATWSGLVNYDGFTQTCLAEALLSRKSTIAQQATPSEIGGYAVTLDPSFSNSFLNAGGMQAQICTRGETDAYGGVQWHTLGITRFSRAGFDSRLGPGAGHVNPDFSDGVSFSPAFEENGKWTRVCLQPQRFVGAFRADFVSPVLVRGTYTIAPVPGQNGPTFTLKIALTPDGALVDTARTGGAQPFGVMWPLFRFDGRTVLNTQVGANTASTAFPRAVGARKTLPLTNAKKDGPGLQWSGVDGGKGGATEIGFRYALAGDEKTVRHAKLWVNGAPQSDLTFLSTSANDDFHQLYVLATLKGATTNTVRLQFVESEGAPLVTELRVYGADESAPEPDQQNFIALGNAPRLDASAPLVRGGYGDFLPVRASDGNGNGATVQTFVYPRNAGDPSAALVRASFRRSGQDFSSVLGRVRGNVYVGRTAAGGQGNAVDLNGDGKTDVSFDQTCTFVMQLRQGRVAALETDRAVRVSIGGKARRVAAFTPLALP